MSRILATIKSPYSEVEIIMKQLYALGVKDINLQMIPYEKFISESRMNYDCVYQQAWDEKVKVTYLSFSFEDSKEGREKCYYVEFNLKQIPLNIRYEMT